MRRRLATVLGCAALLLQVGDTAVMRAQQESGGSSAAFSIKNYGAVSQTTSGSSTATTTGYARIRPDAGSTSPPGVAIFGFRQNNILVSEAGVPASPSSLVVLSFRSADVTVSEAGVAAAPRGHALRMYAETSGAESGSIKTGVAITNPNSFIATVRFGLTTLNGESIGSTGQALVPADGQIALFLNQIRGFESLAPPFQGVLRIFEAGPGIAVTGLRGRYNERGDFLITTTPPVDEASAPATGDLVFPHLADTFTSELSTGISVGNDPELVRLPDGSIRMYYNWGDDNYGTIYSTKCPAPNSATR